MKPMIKTLTTISLLVIGQYTYASSIVYPVANKAQLITDAPTDSLQRYVGDYEIAPDQRLSVSLSNDTLYILPPNETVKAALKLVTNSEFIVVGEEARLIFKKDSAGKIIEVEIRFGSGASAVAKKV